MTRSRFLTLAAVFAVVACTDNPNGILTGPIDPEQPLLPTPSLATLSGRISVSGAGDDRLIELRDASGGVYRLVGSESGALASVDGGDVVARGTFDANPGFVVQDFQVTGMHGRPALDGVLEVTQDGFALRLANDELRAVPLRADCIQHVGYRLWVVGWEDPQAEFGVIAPIF